MTLQDLHIMPDVLGTFQEKENVCRRMLWFMRDGSNALFRQLQTCQDVSVLRFQLRFRMYILKPHRVGGHFYDVTLNKRFHILIQMDPQELDYILHTILKSFMITDEVSLTSFERMHDVEVVAASFLDFNPAADRIFIYAHAYDSSLPNEIWIEPSEIPLEPDSRCLEVYTFNDGKQVNMLLPNSM